MKLFVIQVALLVAVVAPALIFAALPSATQQKGVRVPKQIHTNGKCSMEYCLCSFLTKVGCGNCKFKQNMLYFAIYNRIKITLSKYVICFVLSAE